MYLIKFSTKLCSVRVYAVVGWEAAVTLLYGLVAVVARYGSECIVSG